MDNIVVPCFFDSQCTWFHKPTRVHNPNST